MILNEQLYKNLYRPYFRGQRIDYDEKKSNFQNIKFYTINPVYALFYAKKEGIIYKYRLKNQVNIFNARNRTDFDKLHSFIVNNHTPVSYDTLEKLKTEDWVSVLDGDKNRSLVLDIIKNDLMYDGFFNYEWTQAMKKDLMTKYENDFNLFMKLPVSDKNPSIGIFNKDSFIEVDSFSYKEFIELEQIKAFKKNEIESLENFFIKIKATFGKDAAYKIITESADNWLVLTADEANKIIDDLYNKKFNVEEAKQLLNFLENTKRPGFKEAAARLREEIDAQTK